MQPDFLCLAKGLTGGYLPMAATLTTQEVFDAFLGEYHECKTFFHGHSYTGNQLGAAAALASLEILQNRKSVTARSTLENALAEELKVARGVVLANAAYGINTEFRDGLTKRICLPA